MPDDTMIERVARAMADINADGCEVTDGGGSIAACTGPCLCRELARAAITAMREPTYEMELAGSTAVDSPSLDRGDAYAAWRAMIDAALEEKP